MLQRFVKVLEFGVRPHLRPPPALALMQNLEQQLVKNIAMEAAIAARANDDPRLLRLNYYVGATGLAWLLFCIYYLIAPSVSDLSFPCFIAAMVALGHYFVGNFRLVKKKNVANSFLACSTLSVVFCALYSDSECALPQYFFPVLCLISAQVLGVKVTVKWYLLVGVATYFCYFPTVFFHSAIISEYSLERMLVNLALSFAVVWMSDQSEQFLDQRSTEFSRLTESLRENARLLELAEETAGVGHWRWNMVDEQFEFSDELNRIIGHESADVPSLGVLLNCFDAKDTHEFYSALMESRETGKPFDCNLRLRKDEEVRFVSARGISERDEDGKVTALFGVIRDDTELKQATTRLAKKAKELRKLASFDPLTGLANRFLFRKHLHHVVRNSVEKDKLSALLVLDMDGFKEVNDTLGHHVGDLVLKRTAKRIRNIVGKENVVARLGGDEFTVILKSPESEAEVIEIGKRIVAKILKPMMIDDSELHVGASIGACLCPVDSHSPDELFTYADTAMYAAKFDGKDIVVYESWMTEELVERKRVESRLSGALLREEFHIVYQPQVSFEGDRINGFEALVRWNHNGETVSPAEFIPMLESSGKIVEVGNWILEEACQQAAVWHRLGYEFTMAINISPAQFREDDFAQNVIKIIVAKNLPPHLIDIEITETMLIADVGQTSRTLKQLRDFGTQISIDDFGTGYSSLAYLKDFPIDRLKIDRTFIKDFPQHDDGMIASSIIVLGQSLDLEVLAEGVETEAQKEFLKANLCNSYQGHLFSPPIEPTECLKMLQRQSLKKPVQRQTVES
jgi:diguanylate cyclase (GGDEF)-like protein